MNIYVPSMTMLTTTALAIVIRIWQNWNFVSKWQFMLLLNGSEITICKLILQNFKVVIARGNDVATPVTFSIRDIDIPVNENVKVLGIHIDNKLKFDKHISELCKRASKHINAISRFSQFVDEKCRISLYHSFILSHFHYCKIVWHNCDTENTIKIEKIQKRPLRLSWMIIHLAMTNF